MCHNTLSIGWDGYLYDCDLNQMLGLKVTLSTPPYIREFSEEALAGHKIVINNHCYGCTAGVGSGCQGALT